MANTKVTGDVIANGTISTVHIADDAITAAKLDSTATGITFADLAVSGNSTLTGNLTVNGNFTSIGIDDNADARAITINGNEEVGIGTTSPTYKLHVAGTTAITGNLTMSTSAEIRSSDGTGIRLRNAANSANEGGFVRSGLWEGDSSRDPSLFAETGLGLRFYTGGSATERMYIDSSGNVGIGTSSPRSKLDVNGLMTQEYGNAYQIKQGSTEKYYYSNGASYNAFGTGVLGIGTTSDAIQFATNNSVKATITSGGSVGIGTTSPGHKLDVDGKIRSTGGMETTYIDFTGPSSQIGTDTYSGAFYVYDNSAYRMVVKTGTGNVGIGTVSPSQKLSVNGNISIAGGHTLKNDGNNDFEISSTTNEELLLLAGGGMHLRTNGNTERLTILQGGNVGIGNTSPANLLHLKGDNRGIIIGDNNTTVGDTIGEIQFYASNNSSYSAGIKSQIASSEPGIDRVSLSFHTTTYTTSLQTGAERMRITSVGDVLLGGHAANGSVNPVLNGYGFQANGLATGVCNFSGTNEMFVLNQRDGSGTTQLEFRNGNVERGRIEWTTSATTYNTISDYRLKENINNLTDSLLKINQLQPKSFNFISDPNELRIGFIAHEVQEIVPQAVTGTKDEIREDNTPKYQGLDNSMLVPLLVGAIKEQQEIINDLKNRIQTLENN